jgi:hemolysin-activating ACP:hemolysin acyltransferase
MWAKTISRANQRQYWSQIMDLYTNSPLGRQLDSSILNQYVREPMRSAQMRIYGEADQVQAVATWACLSEVEAERYENTSQVTHWDCGDHIYVIDVIAKGLNMFKVIRELRNYGFQRYGQRHFKWFRQDYGQNKSRKGWC